MDTILITGAHGQIGQELIPALSLAHPHMHLLGVGRTSASQAEAMVSQIRPAQSERTAVQNVNYAYEALDVRDESALKLLTQKFNIKAIYHLASLLSAKGEKSPSLCWDINVNGLKNILDLARDRHLSIFWPSSIAVFGPHTPQTFTPQSAPTDPRTMYGITKASGELLCQYYAQQYQVDVRSLRLPGVISHRVRPGGGTTDYAVNMFYSAVESQQYACFVAPQTQLPMIYMPDCIHAIIKLMQADRPDSYLSYNLTAFSPTAAELVRAIQVYQPAFRCQYHPDYRQAIADSWPATIDDTAARQDWGWEPQYDLAAMVKDMIAQLSWRYSHGDPNPASLSVAP